MMIALIVFLLVDQSASSATGDQSAALNTGNDGTAEVLDGERRSFGVAVATG